MNSEFGQEVIGWTLAFIVAIVMGFLFREYCFELYTVDGPSMLPTLSTGDRLIVNKMGYNFHEIERGDIVVFRYPREYNTYFVKRIIGIPGDTVEISNGRVFVNDKELNEFSYTVERPERGFSKDVVPEKSYFVLGDNRNNSEDSRFKDVGFVSERLVVGKAICIAWPFFHVKKLDLPLSEPLVVLGR